MRVLTLTPSLLQRNRPQLLAFVRQNGDSRITRKAVQWLETATLEPQAAGTLILVALADKKLVGLFAIAAHGLEEALLVVHRAWRRRGIGKLLCQASQQHLTKLYVRVALDNTASLRCFLQSGFVGVQLIDGPTGKPTLCLASGAWSRADLPAVP
ncbi:GNAT family N-acetyltransferase [Brevibacillus marinus]|jgi:GNAT superfamily N-acetyltransferase|uniref:GNAT family N-acetyltransferase n=1 Tax=Brevibacillus marinus TaxID=2496837 RepID=UPI000F836D4D|nr:GNAT family N-acetyltransferase [Brevibacillus marinus]